MISSQSSRKTLSLLREWMAAKKLTCYIVPSADNHQGEYVAACDERRAFVSGFDGSSGTAVIGMQDALLWTDGRYFIQAERQLSEEWSLKKMFIDPPMIDYLCHHTKEGGIGSHVGIDPTKISIHEGKSWSSALRASGGELHLIHENPVDAIWEDRPELPSGNIFAHDDDLVGSTFDEKRSQVISALSLYESSSGKSCTSIFLTSLPEIAWLFNLRGSDVLYTPIFWAYAYVSESETVLFVDEHRMDEGVAARLKESSVSIRPYAEALDFVSKLSTTAEPGSVYTDPSTCNYGIFHSMGHAVSSSSTKSPVAFIKSIKTPIELQGFRNSHLRDGAALSKFFAWMEDKVQKNPKHPLLTEVGVSQVLETQFRGTQPRFVSLSFETIAAYGENGACIHYAPTPKTDLRIGRDSLFLLDSGSQYLDGTTDVTRTVHFGKPTDWMRECYTLVLKGLIAVQSTVFPKGVSGNELDAMARKPLWKKGLDFAHGTGHGVGYFLSVHEGPIGISKRPTEPLTEGNVVTIEPGYYEEGEFGIRLENMVIVKKAMESNHRTFLQFEPLTFVPFEPNLINLSMMNKDEIQWLNDYHHECFARIRHLLKDPSSVSALEWIRARTQPLPTHGE